MNAGSSHSERDALWFEVDRPRLVKRIEAAAGRDRLLQVIAPAGYGKTTLLHQWAHADRSRRVAWTSLQESDVDAWAIAERLRHAVAEVEPDVAFPPLDRPAHDRQVLDEQTIDHLAAMLSAVAPMTLVIDDIHRPPALLVDGLGELARRVPSGVTIALLGRIDPLLDLTGLRTAGLVTDMRQDLLGFDLDETTRVFERVAPGLVTVEQIEASHRRINGWPVCTVLAVAGVRDHSEPDEFITNLTWGDAHVMPFLTSEVLNRQPEPLRQFMLETAVLDQLRPDLCEAVTGRADAAAHLLALERQLLVGPRVTDSDWTAYLPPLPDLLRAELRSRRPGLERELLGRAAAWHHGRNDSEAAARCHVLAEDWPALIDLVDRTGEQYFRQSRAALPVAWLSAVPDDVLLAAPDAALMLAGLLSMVGRTRAAEDVLDRLEGSVELDPTQAAEAMTIRASWVFHHVDPDRGGVVAQRATDLLRAAPPRRPALLGLLTASTLRAIAAGSEALAASATFRLGRAKELFDEVAEGPGQLVWVLHALGESAWIDATTGDLGAAQDRARRALRLADEDGLAGHAACVVAHFALARAQRERRERDSSDHLAEAAAIVEANPRHRLEDLLAVEDADADLARGRWREAIATLEQLRASGRPILGPDCAARAASLLGRAQLLEGDVGSARTTVEEHRGLTTSELLATRAAVSADAEDLGGLQKVLEGWHPVDGGGRAAELRLRLWTAVFRLHDGDRDAARLEITGMIEDAAVEHHVGLVLEAGHRVRRQLRPLRPIAAWTELDRLLDDERRGRSTEVPGLVEPFSDRELSVLAFLPTRLSNAEIGERLYVSVNTVKTHVKAIYRKLGASNRREAVERAEELGLL